MKEIESQREFYETAKPEAIRKYFEDGVYKVGASLARNGVIPPPEIISLEPKTLRTDQDVAQMLATVEVDDPHFQKIDFATDEGKKDATILAVGKLTSVAEQRPDLKKKLQGFGDKVVSGIIDFFEEPANPARKVFLKTAPVVGLALVATACGPNVVVNPIIPDGGGAGSTATEVSPTATVSPTETAKPTPTKTARPSPTETAKPLLPEVTLGSTKVTFTSIRFDNVYNTYNDLHYFSGDYRFIIISGSYKGDPRSLIAHDGPYYTTKKLYLESPEWPHYRAFIVSWDGRISKIDLVYYIRAEDIGPFTLHDDLNNWSLDLSPLPVTKKGGQTKPTATP